MSGGASQGEPLEVVGACIGGHASPGGEKAVPVDIGDKPK